MRHDPDLPGDSVSDAGAGTPSGEDRRIAAPGLGETARIWFDSDLVPEVHWDAAGTHFELVEGIAGTGAPEATSRARITLLRVEAPVARPRRIAQVLAEGLAACDFPPTADGASRHLVDAALRAAGLDPASL
jgi:hypothetical protein